MFGWFKKYIKVDLIKIGDIRALDDNPFNDTRTVTKVIDLSGGWVKFLFCDFIDGDWKPRPINYGRAKSLDDYRYLYDHLIEEGRDDNV